MTHSELYRGLLKDISAFPVLDTHEHVESEARRLSRPVDLFNTFLIHYAACDLVSAGMPDGDLAFLRGDDPDLERKWRVFAPHWANARNTAYCRSLLRASEAIYGVGDINETTWRVLDRAIKARNQKGLYRRVLKELCNIEASIVDSDPACDRQFFRTTLRVDGWLAPKSGGFLRANGERFGLPVAEVYGQTENCGVSTMNPPGAIRIGTVGKAVPGVEIRIVDPENGRVLPQGDVGVLEVRGPNVFAGYWRMPEKTKTEFRADGFFITGDVSKIDERGYVHIVGRAKDLVITGGYNVYPKEVESEIDAIKGVFESAVLGCPHPDFGEGVTAAVVVKPGASVTAGAIASALEDRLAKFKLPKQVFIVPELPRNTMGKVQKNLLREQYKDIYARAKAGA